MTQKRRKSKQKKPKPQSLFGIRFRSPALAEAALTHPSYRHETNGAPGKLENFDRLEFLGDAVLNLIICKELFRRFPEADEGTMSRLRSILVSRKILSRISREIHLGKLIKTGPSVRKQGPQSRDKILADSFEAFLAALYFDRGEPAAAKFLMKHFLPYLDEKRLLRLDPNPKSTLQELCQKKWQRLPVYESESGPGGALVKITIHRNLKASTSGRSRRDAEEKAARTLLKKVRQALAAGSAKVSSGKKLRKG